MRRCVREGAPETSTTLLNALARDSQSSRWDEFVARYRPMMEAFMRERFPSVDADDAIQETLVALHGIIPVYRYAPDEKGRFRCYLTGILRNKAMRVLRDERRQAEAVAGMARSGPPSALQREGAAPSAPQWHADLAGEQSFRETVFEIALHEFLADESVADRTKRVFERTALNGEPPEAVASSFNMTRHAVDQAKCRSIARIRELVSALEALADA